MVSYFLHRDNWINNIETQLSPGWIEWTEIVEEDIN